MSGARDEAKLLVRKIHHDTTEEELRELYSTWGEIEDCKIVRNKETNRSRGFGFIRYVNASSVEDAIAARPHTLGGNTLEPHRSAPKEYSERIESHHTVNEIFVGKMQEEIDENDLTEYFAQYGNVEKVSIPKDNEGKMKGFAVVTFDDYDPVDVTCFKRVHEIKEKKLFISKYIPKKELEELKQRYGNQNGYESQGYGNGRQAFPQMFRGMYDMDYQSSGFGGGPMRGKMFGGRGGGNPYGGRGRRNWNS